MAGESARALAHTRRTRAEHLLRSAEAYERGAAGEEATAQALASLPAGDWRVFHDVRWPGRHSANIDHVLVGPGGVFVIDSKAWSGDVDVEDGVLRQNGRKRDRYALAAADAAKAVGDLLPAVGPQAVNPVLCLVRAEPVFGWSHDVMVCSTANITTFLESRPRVLDDAARRDVAEVLARELVTASGPMPVLGSGHGRRVATAPTPRAARRPRRRSRSRVAEPIRLTAIIGALVLAAAVAFQFGLIAKVTELGSQAAERVVSPTEPIGTTVPVPASGPRPSLTVSAGQPVVTRSTTRGVSVRRGHRLVAVPLTVSNTDDKVWASRSDVTSLVVDQEGLSYSSDPAFTRVRGGRTLPASLKLRPGKTTRGFLVFEVPRTVEVTKVQLRVGPSLPKTVRWSVG